MAFSDVEGVDALATRTFDDLRVRAGLEPPVPGDRAVEDIERSRARMAHLLAGHPEGCWVVDDPDGDRLAAAGLALRHERFWGLSLLVVDPARQGAGLGSAMLRATLASAEGCDRRMIVASSERSALRAYARAGFSLHPGLHVEGTVDRARIPAGADHGVREGAEADREWIDELDRRRRGGAHGDDLDHLLAHGGSLLVAERGRARGYAVRWDEQVGLLAADHVACARALVWHVLGEAGSVPTGVRYACGAHQWLVDLAVTAGLSLQVRGAICTVGFDPPATYLPSGPWL